MKEKTTIIPLIGIILLLCWSGKAGAEDDADLILFNGKIITIDAHDNTYQAIAVKNGKIISLGNDVEIKAMAGTGCKMIDLKGKTATPGLIDAHYHLMYYGQQFWEGYLNIRHPDVKSKADLLRVVGDKAKQLKEDEWISGNQGFHLGINETLDRYDLDGVAPRNPAYLRHGSGQFAVVNTRALEIAKITKDTSNPPSSLILRDSQGEVLVSPYRQRGDPESRPAADHQGSPEDPYLGISLCQLFRLCYRLA